MAHELKGGDPSYRPSDYPQAAMSAAEALRFSVSVRSGIVGSLGGNLLPQNFLKSWAVARKHVS